MVRRATLLIPALFFASAPLLATATAHACGTVEMWTEQWKTARDDNQRMNALSISQCSPVVKNGRYSLEDQQRLLSMLDEASDRSDPCMRALAAKWLLIAVWDESLVHREHWSQVAQRLGFTRENYERRRGSVRLYDGESAGSYCRLAARELDQLAANRPVRCDKNCFVLNAQEKSASAKTLKKKAANQ